MEQAPSNNEASSGTSALSAGLERKLTPEQIENWRNVLLGMIGPYALIMPVEQVQKWRDKFKEQVNKLSIKE